MALIKLMNIGEEVFKGIFNGEEYIINPDKTGKSYIIVSEKIAKHWFGDWDLKDEKSRRAEAKRVKIYHTQNPKPKFKIKMEKVIEKQEPKLDRKSKPEEIEISSNVVAPNEKEFEDLDSLEADEKEPDKGSVSKKSSKLSSK